MDQYAVVLAAVDWAQVALDVVGVAAMLAAVFVVMRGARMLLSMIKGDSYSSGGDVHEDGELSFESDETGIDAYEWDGYHDKWRHIERREYADFDS